MYKTRPAAALVLLALVAALTGLPHLHPASASAATTGAGIPGLTPYGNYLGNYIAPDGARVYCIDSSLAWPAGTTTGAELVETVHATWGQSLPEESLLKLNYVLLAYGQTDDPVQAAAVAAFVYAYTSGWARDLGPGYAAGAFYLDGNTEVTRAYDAIWADAEAHAIPAATATVEIEMVDATSGVVVVSASAPDAVGTLQLTGAVVSETGEQTASVSASTEVAIRGLPADDARDYSIAATVSYSLTTPAAANLVLYATGDQQRTVRGGTPGSLSFQASTVTDLIPVEVPPVVTPPVPVRSVEPGAVLPRTGSSPAGAVLLASSMLASGALGISARRRRWVEGE